MWYIMRICLLFTGCVCRLSLWPVFIVSSVFHIQIIWLFCSLDMAVANMCKYYLCLHIETVRHLNQRHTPHKNIKYNGF